MVSLSERLKALRKTKDMTQEQLAEYMGVSPQAVSRWETGATSPDISALPQLADLFGISIDELLGYDETERHKEISSVIDAAEEQINKNITEKPITELRKALNKYPNNDRLLTCLMYALYVASENDDLCRKYDPEIISIYDRIQKYSADNYCRNETLRLLFRHYCDTDRIAEAKRLATNMASVETCYDYNIYWALKGEERVSFLENRISGDLRQLSWDIWAYSVHSDISDDEKQQLNDLRQEIELKVKNKFCIE
ncbi:MAG: helix-turn-helix transcriptional regulator [Alphaproteobacteria bacterium]|nr:helix-turn-helix transcriptional regulator [Alphaproteobacteria bacterium]